MKLFNFSIVFLIFIFLSIVDYSMAREISFQKFNTFVFNEKQGNMTSIMNYNALQPALNTGIKNSADSIELEPEDLGWNWHKITGYATLASGIATMITAFQGKDRAHCGLAYTTAALAVTSTCTGFYRYSGKLGLSADKFQDTSHAVGSMFATVGFITTSILPGEGKPHGRVGIASGMVFMLSIGVLYF